LVKLAAAVLWLGSVGGAALAQQGAPAFVECELPPQAFVGEVVEAVVRIGCDEQFFRESAVPLFQQRLDRPFQVLVPWLQARSDRAVELGQGPADGPRLAVGDRVLRGRAAGRRDVQGRTYELLELRARWTVLAAGEHAVEPVQLRYAFATAFEEHFLRGRQPLDRQDATVQSAATVLRGLELPSIGRPAGFHGAIGVFLVTASTGVASVPVGGSFPLVVTVRGDGNLERFPAPPWPELPGLLVQGLVERRRPGAREFEFDVLALRAGLAAVPPVGFTMFVPREQVYRTVYTAPLPLLVTPSAGVLPPRLQELVAADAASQARASARPGWFWGLVAGGLLLLLGLAARWRASLRRATALAAALAELDRALGRGPEAALAALAALAAECGKPGALAEGPPSVDPAHARLRELAGALDRARYGGVPPSAADVAAAAREFVRARG
jgi:hypothetical protein